MTFEATPGSPPEDDTTLAAEGAAVEAAAEDTDANAAASSTVDEPGAKEPASLLDVVKSAVEKPAEQADSPTAGDEDGEAPNAEEAAAQAAAEAADADADLPFHNHPRWKEVIAERDSFRDDAERYGNITGFMQQHGLETSEVVEGFEVMALLKSGDPDQLAAARDYFHTRLQQLDGMLGNILPEDLQQRVEAGQIDEDAAQELARTRASEQLRTERDRQREEANSQSEAERQRAANVTAAATAIEGWEKRIKASDPDYSKKAKLIETTSLAIVMRTGKPPKSADEALALADQAYAEVNAHFASVVPPKKAIAPSPRGSSTPAKAEPKTLREAITASLGG